jgi:hypothetical protein
MNTERVKPEATPSRRKMKLVRELATKNVANATVCCITFIVK